MKSMMRSYGFALCLLFAAFLSPFQAQETPRGAIGKGGQVMQAQPIQGFDIPRTKIYREQYRLLINVRPLPGRGMMVWSLEPGSPTANMSRVGSPDIHGRLEPGDIITHVNSQPVPTVQTYYAALARSGGRLTLTVIDRRVGQAIDWNSKAILGLLPILPDEGQQPVVVVPGVRIAHVLLIGLTLDRNIGKDCQTDLKNMEKLLRTEVAQDKLDLQVIAGADCNAMNIINRVRQVGQRMKPGDSIFCYFSGHGAYDPRFAANDPSGGHYLAMPGGDLLRKTLFDNLLNTPARLKVLVTDTCSVQSVAHPAGRLAYEQMQITTRGPTPQETLLLYHRGVLDLSATSHGQYSWGNASIGGWFTHTYTRLVPGYADWQPFLDKLVVDSNAFFLTMRENMLAHPANHSQATLQAIQGQTAMNPAIYYRNLTKDTNIPTGPARTYTRIIPTLHLN